MALDGKTNYEQARDDNDILGRDPVGPLAPLGGAEPLLQRPCIFYAGYNSDGARHLAIQLVKSSFPRNKRKC
jgi:hypothetical protein